jgi:hypothetical protein
VFERITPFSFLAFEVIRDETLQTMAADSVDVMPADSQYWFFTLEYRADSIIVWCHHFFCATIVY